MYFNYVISIDIIGTRDYRKLKTSLKKKYIEYSHEFSTGPKMMIISNQCRHENKPKPRYKYITLLPPTIHAVYDLCIHFCNTLHTVVSIVVMGRNCDVRYFGTGKRAEDDD